MQKIKSVIAIAFWLLCLWASLAYSQEKTQPLGSLSSREKSFVKLDRNKDQFISAQEFKGDVSTFLTLDCNHDQMLSHDEYVFADCKLDKKEMAFRALDKNGDGVIELKEWQRSDEEFNELDRDRNGVLTRNELNPSTKSKIIREILGQLL
jgi:Ca2+-binding EF-hand superfamily protein